MHENEWHKAVTGSSFDLKGCDTNNSLRNDYYKYYSYTKSSGYNNCLRYDYNINNITTQPVTSIKLYGMFQTSHLS